jgi:S-adenosylmethionine hydrolase
MAMDPRPAVVSLTTDFGAADHFVGVMKGVVLAINPLAALVDITHGVPPQDVAAGAYQLSNACRHFPAGTVHVAVVDPGVGTDRRAIVLAAGGMLFVAPDNGLLTPFLDEAGARLFEIREPGFLADAPSPTFHGRDVFAPAAAHLSLGVPPERLGPPAVDPVRLPHPAPSIDGTTIHAHVLHVDRFGNVVLDIEWVHLARAGAAAGTRRLRAEAGHPGFRTSSRTTPLRGALRAS